MKCRLRMDYISLLIVTILYVQPTIAFALGVQLIWTANSDASISHYDIYRSNSVETGFALISTISYPDTIYNDETIQLGMHYYYAVTAIDTFGRQSNFSNVVDIYVSSTPVELTSFSGYAEDGNAILEWETASATNNYGFEIERYKKTIGDFKRIGFVNGSGTTSAMHKYRFVDEHVPKGTYLYRLRQIDFDETFELSNTVEIAIGLTKRIKLNQNYPNPFNSTTNITYSIPQEGHVELIIYNMMGQEIVKLVDEYQKLGIHTVQWDGVDGFGKKVVTGLYFYRLTHLGSSSFIMLSFIK